MTGTIINREDALKLASGEYTRRRWPKRKNTMNDNGIKIILSFKAFRNKIDNINNKIMPDKIFVGLIVLFAGR
jgi:hypothetical protein